MDVEIHDSFGTRIFTRVRVGRSVFIHAKYTHSCVKGNRWEWYQTDRSGLETFRGFARPDQINVLNHLVTRYRAAEIELEMKEKKKRPKGLHS